jgi:hypothetical protein
MEMSSRPPALPKRSGADARGSRLSDLSTPLPATQGGRTVEFDAGQQSSGLELKTEPAQARAEDQARQGRSVPPQARPVDADPTKPRAAAQGRTRPAEHSRSLHPAAAEPAHERIAPPETATSEAEPKVGSDRPSQRPRKNEKRAEARREARRKAAKQLPPPPAPTVKKRWDAARITLAAFVGVVAMSALVLGAALAGWLPLPPSAAAMLGLSQASLARVDGTKPHLVMPSAPEAPAQRPAVVRLDLPAVKPEPAVAPAPQAEAPAAEAAPAPQAEAPAAEAVPAPQAEAPAAEAAPEPQAEEPAAEAAPDAPVAEAAPALPAGTEAMSPAALLNAARARLRAGDAPGAAELLTQALAKDPDDHHAMEALVRAWLAMKRGQDALPYVQQIVKKRPKRAAYRVLEGDVRRSLGDEAGAAAAFREALRLEPDNREAKQKLGS